MLRCAFCGEPMGEDAAVDITADPWLFLTAPDEETKAHRKCADLAVAELEQERREMERDYWSGIAGGLHRDR